MNERHDVDRVLESIEPLPRARAWPALVMLVGPPGTGKSTLSSRLAERTPLVVLNSDDIRRQLVDAADYSFNETKRVLRAVRLAIGDLLHRNITVVLDSPNLTEWERSPFYSLADLHKARLIIVEVTAPTAVVLERLGAEPAEPVSIEAARGRGSMQSVLSQITGRQEPITRDHLTVDTSLSIDQFVEGLVLDLDEG